MCHCIQVHSLLLSLVELIELVGHLVDSILLLLPKGGRVCLALHGSLIQIAPELDKLLLSLFVELDL